MKSIKALQNQIVKDLCKKEIGKKQINAGDAREIIKIISQSPRLLLALAVLTYIKGEANGK